MNYSVVYLEFPFDNLNNFLFDYLCGIFLLGIEKRFKFKSSLVLFSYLSEAESYFSRGSHDCIRVINKYLFSNHDRAPRNVNFISFSLPQPKVAKQ